MKTKYCQNSGCGIELTPENAYSRSGERFRPFGYCKKCDHKRRTKNYNPAKRKALTVGNKKFGIKVKRGNSRAFKITFDTIEEKRSFVTYRRLQIRWGRCSTSRSSTCGQRAETLTELKIGKKTYRFYVASECDECGKGSELKTDALGYKYCTTCGLTQGEPVEEENNASVKSSHHPGTNGYLHKPAETDDERQPDERCSTYDYHYATAYARRRK